MNVRRITVALALLAAFVPAEATAGSVRVRVLRLSSVPASWKSRQLSVRVSIGTRALYTTPAVSGDDAAWNRGLRAFTASTNPLRFEVLADGGGGRVDAPVAREPPREKRPRRAERHETADEILAAGLDDLVADYGEGTLDEGASGPARPAEPSPEVQPPRARTTPESGVLCTATLAWPPSPGEHALACGAATLVIRIQ